MNLGGIVQAYTALAESLANKLIAGNIASASDESPAVKENTTVPQREQSPVKEAASAAPARAASGVATTEKAALPDTRPAQKGANVASQTLVGLRPPATSVASNAASLTKLVTTYMAAMANGASASSDAPAQQPQTTSNAARPASNSSTTPASNSSSSATLVQGAFISKAQSAQPLATTTVPDTASAKASALNPAANPSTMPASNRSQTGNDGQVATHPSSTSAQTAQSNTANTGPAQNTPAQQPGAENSSTKAGTLNNGLAIPQPSSTSSSNLGQSGEEGKRFEDNASKQAAAPNSATPQGALANKATMTSPHALPLPGALPEQAESLTQQTAATQAALARNAAGQTGTIHGTPMPLPKFGEQEDEAADTPGATDQQSDPRLSLGKRILNLFIPPQAPGDANTADEDRRESHTQAMNTPSRSHASANGAARPKGEMSGAATETADASHSADAPNTRTSARPGERLAHAFSGQISSDHASLGEASLGEASLGELLNQTKLERPGNSALNALGHEQLMGRMQGMDAVILNAAMIPGWPAPRPFEMPKQIGEAQARKLLAKHSEQAAQLGTSTQSQTKDEAEIQTYLLNMGMKKSLLSKLRAALRPAKRKIKLLFGLAVLVSQAVFTLHTVLDELNSMEEEEDDMMQDPSELQRRLKG